ncbi:hypothetical protein DV737_g1397, partial [Chaetothyriales sp. CBS 132003]
MAAATSSTAPLPAIYSLSSPHGQITADNHGGYVVICGWIMMCFFTISIFGIAQTVAIHISAVNGLGQHQSSLSAKSFRTYATSYYAANMLYFFTVYFAKISLVMIIMRLSPARFVQRLCIGVLILTTAWILAEIFAFAFQSPTPQVWNYTQTRPGGVNVPALYYTATAGDIISDLLVILLPAYVIWQVQISLKKRLAIISVFSIRMSVIMCSIIRIPTLTRYVSSTDRSWHAVGPQTWIQIIQCLSIITACVPCLKPFLEALESGFMDPSLGKIRGDTYRARSSGLGTGDTSGHAGQKSTGTSSSTATKRKSRLKSQRVLMRLSADGDEASKHSWEETKSRSNRLGAKFSDDTIKVTREVEVRDEASLPHAISTEGDMVVHNRGSGW